MILPLRYYRGQTVLSKIGLEDTRHDTNLQYALFLTHRLFGSLARHLSEESASLVTLNYFENVDLLAIAVPTLPAEMLRGALLKDLYRVTGKRAVCGLYESCLRNLECSYLDRTSFISVDDLDSLYWEASIQLPAPEHRGYNQLLAVGRTFIAQMRVATQLARAKV